jgi:hypothetical protein
VMRNVPLSATVNRSTRQHKMARLRFIIDLLKNSAES